MKAKQNRAAVLLWLYHIDLWPEFRQLLLPISGKIKLYVGLDINNSVGTRDIICDISKNFNHFYIQFFENRGVDVRPFINQLAILDQITEPVFFKLHSKKSMWGFKNHVNWRSILTHSLIGSPKIFSTAYQRLLRHDTGMCCSEGLKMHDREFPDKRKILEICDILSINYNSLSKKPFCGGNIFAGNTKLFQSYINKKTLPKLNALLFNEKSKVNDYAMDGSYSHSLERIFGYLVEYSNKKIYSPRNITYQIVNHKAPKGYFNLVINYDSSCYITEDLNVYGYVLEHSKNSLLIEWLHLSTITRQKYDIRQGMLHKQEA